MIDLCSSSTLLNSSYFAMFTYSASKFIKRYWAHKYSKKSIRDIITHDNSTLNATGQSRYEKNVGIFVKSVRPNESYDLWQHLSLSQAEKEGKRP